MLPEQIHCVWMNGRYFIKNGSIYQLKEGTIFRVGEELYNGIKFIETETGKEYEITEEEFFEKVDIKFSSSNYHKIKSYL